MPADPKLIPSATVVLVRDHQARLEVLLLQKAKSINFGGTWVFPGGVIEENDAHDATRQLADDSIESTAKVAAVRETKEESGIQLQPQQLHSFSHWTTPKLKSKRYSTWFFIADANRLDTEVTIDDGEIVEARWITPKQALESHAQDEVRLNGPSFVTLSEMSGCNSVAEALGFYQSRKLTIYEPRGFIADDAFISLYQSDSAYHLSDQLESAAEVLNSKPPLHRLYMRNGGAWEYIKSEQTG